MAKLPLALENKAIALAVSFLGAKEALDGPAQTAAWWGSARAGALQILGLHSELKPRFNPALAQELRTLRAAGARLVEALSTGAPVPAEGVETLNRTLERAHPVLRPGAEFGFAVGDGMDVVLVSAAYAIASLAQSDLRRLGRCRLPGCAAYFWDATKNRSRRWCSLRCMERDRAPRRRLER